MGMTLRICKDMWKSTENSSSECNGKKETTKLANDMFETLFFKCHINQSTK